MGPGIPGAHALEEYELIGTDSSSEHFPSGRADRQRCVDLCIQQGPWCRSQSEKNKAFRVAMPNPQHYDSKEKKITVETLSNTNTCEVFVH